MSAVLFDDPDVLFDDPNYSFDGEYVGPPTAAGPLFGPGPDQRKKKRKELEKRDAANRRRDTEAVAVWLTMTRDEQWNLS